MKYFLIPSLIFCANFAQAEAVRVATYNASMNRENSGQLTQALTQGSDPQIEKVAKIIDAIAPDLLLINEFDFANGNAKLFNDNYLGNAFQNSFESPSNTGLHSGLDLDNNGTLTDTPGNFDYANDSYGFGLFEGQYGMAVFSKYPIIADEVRTFQKFLWSEMPNARRPINPDGTPYHSDAIWEELRLSSKSHWDIPVQINDQVVHFLVSHPTPPVFDGPEDKNGTRNADEIRFWQDYISGAEYFRDDSGRNGGLEEGAIFVIAGDLNADPNDGDSTGQAINALLSSDLINTSQTPYSQGAIEANTNDGGLNAMHIGDPSFDTADWNDEQVGNLRVDYVLPSKNVEISDAKVFWPKISSETRAWIDASDHRAVWIDLDF